MERMKFFAIFLTLTLFSSQAFAARQVLNENASPSAKGGLNSNFSKANANFVELYAADLLKADALGVDDNYVTDAEKVKLGNLSGTNTGDQNAASISVSDAGGYYTGSTVEAILQEIGLAGFGGGSEVNVNADWNSTSGDSQILNKPTMSPLTASMVTGVFPSGTGALCKDGTVGNCGIETSGNGAWGTITGTLSDQEDLQAALSAISAGGIPHVSSGYPSSSEAWNFNTTDNRLYTRKSNGDVYYTSALTLAASADVTPTGFAFTDITNATLSTEYTACDQITGIDWPATVTASGGAAAICTGNGTGCGTFGTSPGTVANNGWVCARHTSSASNSTATNTPVTVGTESDTFTSTTVAAQAGLTPTFYFNANSETSGQSPTVGTGTVTIGAGTTAVAGVVGNALEIDSTWGGSLAFPGSGNISETVGTLGFYINAPTYAQNGAYVSGGSVNSPYFILEAGATTRWRYMSGGNQELGLTASTWAFVELSWDYANARESVRVNGGTWQQATGLIGQAPVFANVVFGSTDGNVTSFSVDQIMITGGYQDDLYSIRNNTSF